MTRTAPLRLRWPTVLIVLVWTFNLGYYALRDDASLLVNLGVYRPAPQVMTVDSTGMLFTGRDALDLDHPEYFVRAGGQRLPATRQVYGTVASGMTVCVTRVRGRHLLRPTRYDVRPTRGACPAKTLRPSDLRT